MAKYQIATIEGDGIGPEVCQAAVAVLQEACGNNVLDFNLFPGGATHYVRSGFVLPEDTYKACQDSHAIFHGAAGMPEVT